MKKVSVSLVAPLLIGCALFVLGGADSPSNAERLWRHRNLGKAYFETPTALPDAVAELKQAFELAPDSFRDQLNYGLALLRTGQLAEAVAELEKAQAKNPASPYTWFNLGVAYKRLGRYPEATKQFQGMEKLVPDEPVTHYNLGLLYKLANRQDDAFREFETAAKLDPKLVAPRFQLYNMYRLAGKQKETAEALKAFQEVKQAQAAADDTEDMEWCYYAELYDPIEARPAGRDTGPVAEAKFHDETLAGAVDAPTSGLLAIDAFGEHAADLLAWSKNGVRLYRRGKTPVADSGLDGIGEVVSVAAGDFNNDGLTDLCVVTSSGPSLYRNTKGHFEKEKASLPTGSFEAAVWLDFDHDYDLDLFLLGEKSVLLRNEGAAGFHDDTAHFPFEAGHAIAAAAFRVTPDTKEMDLAVAYRDHPGVLYRDQLRGVFKATPIDALPAGARSLQAVDVDNDGWMDLGFVSPAGASLALNREGKFEARAVAPRAASLAFADFEDRGYSDLVAGAALYRDQGLANFAGARKPAGFPDGVAWTAADFDGDGRTDVAAVASDGSLHLLANRTETKNQWLGVALLGVKNLIASAGTEVEVKAGDHYQKKLYQGVPLVFGLGADSRVDTVRLSWPNGLIQNDPKQTPGQIAVLKEAPRLSGSCPMVFSWNGREFQFISDVLGVAPLGASSGDGSYFPVDSDEYIHLPDGALVPRDGHYEVRITEELHEVTYLDQARLMALDHPENIEIFTNDKFKSPPFPEYRLFGVKKRIYPEAARDGKGRDVLAALVRRDREYVKGFRHDLAGTAEMHSLELDFPAGTAPDNRAVLILNGWIDWADGSTFMAASQGGPGLVMPYLQVQDRAGNWRTVLQDMGVPSGGPKTIAVDLTGKFLSASRKVRIVTNVCLYWDQIFLSEDTAPPPVRTSSLDARDGRLAAARIFQGGGAGEPGTTRMVRLRPLGAAGDVESRGGPVHALRRRARADGSRRRQAGHHGLRRRIAAALRRGQTASAAGRLETRLSIAGGRLVEGRRRQHRLRRQRGTLAVPRDEPIPLSRYRAFSRRRRAPRLAKALQHAPGDAFHRQVDVGAQINARRHHRAWPNTTVCGPVGTGCAVASWKSASRYIASMSLKV